MAAGWRGEFIKTKTDLRREYYFSLKSCADLMMRVQTSKVLRRVKRNLRVHTTVRRGRSLATRDILQDAGPAPLRRGQREDAR
jgi:hypothetical protein